MKNALKIVAWFWIVLGLSGLYLIFKGQYTDFIYTDGIIFCIILFVLCGVGLLKRSVFAWWSIVVFSAMLVLFGIIHLIIGIDIATDIVPSVYFIMLFSGSYFISRSLTRSSSIARTPE
jgi:hypothetical protein